MSILTLIIDDEFLARERLKKLLEPFPEIVLVGECKNGEDAFEMIHLKNPDLIFLDIQMPGISGIDLIGKLNQHRVKVPMTVFTTAHNAFAIQAFERNAIDYLLKPFEPERFQHTIGRVKSQMELKQSHELSQQMQRLLQSFTTVKNEFRQSFEIREKGIETKIRVEEVLYLTSESNYLKLVTFQKNWMVRGTLQQISEELNPRDFLRIHRSTIIHLRYLEGYRYLNNHEFLFKMKNGDELTSGRSFYHSIQKQFG